MKELLFSLSLALIMCCLSAYPDVRARKYFQTTDEIIRNNGYPIEEHFAVTDDGYILRIFRMPQVGNTSAHPVLTGQGMSGATDDYILLGPKHDLAYLLHDAGYDVWMGDFRGDFYSRNHTYLSPSRTKFWNFSLNEVGVHDLPTMIDYVLNVTKKEKLAYVGQSMGSTIFFIMMSERPEYNEKVSGFVSIAGSAITRKENLSPFKKFALTLGLRILEEWKKEGRVEILPRLAWSPLAASLFCSKSSFTKRQCFLAFLLWTSVNPKRVSQVVRDWEEGPRSVASGSEARLQEMRENALGAWRPSSFTTYFQHSFGWPIIFQNDIDVMISHWPGGISLNMPMQYLQGIFAGRFQKLDYGEKGNLEMYGSPLPPEYDVSKIRSPSAFYYSEADEISHVKDIEWTISKMTNAVIHTQRLKDFSHLSYILSRDAAKIVFTDVIEFLNKYTW